PQARRTSVDKPLRVGLVRMVGVFLIGVCLLRSSSSRFSPSPGAVEPENVYLRWYTDEGEGGHFAG
ncbi:MAG: hypothetical protein M3P49_03390, partial [Actinomycetota bacterium]|nr:hypothetical protein [Actinomycetota bacterium]